MHNISLNNESLEGEIFNGRLNIDGKVIKIDSITREIDPFGPDGERVTIEGTWLYAKHGAKDPNFTYEIDGIKYKDPITVVYWKDGTKTEVRSGGYPNNREIILCAILYKRLGIKKIVYNPPATIIFWNDNTKTVVKCQEGDSFDMNIGRANAIAKKCLGNVGHFNQIVDKAADDLKAEKLKANDDGIPYFFKWLFNIK